MKLLYCTANLFTSLSIIELYVNNQIKLLIDNPPFSNCADIKNAQIVFFVVNASPDFDCVQNCCRLLLHLSLILWTSLKLLIKQKEVH